MARPRSIPGLLFRLAALHVERRPGGCAAVLALALAALWWWRPSDDRHPAAESRLQGAVLARGFALIHASGAGQRVVVVDPQGAVLRETMVRKPGDPRVVGTRGGAVVAWQDDRKIHLAAVDGERDTTTWGKSVRQMCDGVASNAARFGVGWLEADDSVWFVHGPVAAAAGAADAEPELVRATGDGLVRNDWCGIASAEDNIALLWRNADRLTLGMCTRKKCSSLPVSFKLDRALPILGVGCLRNACLLAARDAAGRARITLLTTSGRSRWNLPLDTAAAAVSIVGVGDRAFAVGFATTGGAEVLKVDSDGKAVSVWRDPEATGAPAVAWAAGRLLIAHFHGDSGVGETIALSP